MEGTIIITGASRGLGFRIAEKFSDNEHPVLLVARNQDGLDNAVKKLTSKKPGISIECFAADLSNPEDIQKLLDFIKQKGLKIEALINNAGIYDYKPFLETGWDEIIQTINLNLTGVILLSHGVIQHMVTNGGGKVINVGSDLSKRPLAKMSAYAASKFGLLGFSRSISQEFKNQNIYVSLVMPGIINNNEIQGNNIDNGMLNPSRIAEIIYFIFTQSQHINFDEVEFHPLMQDY